MSLSSFRQELQKAKNVPEVSSCQTSTTERLLTQQASLHQTGDIALSDSNNRTLSDIMFAVLEICEDFTDEFLLTIGTKRGKFNFHIKLPPPMFFFIENASPFIYSLLGEPLDNNSDIPKKRDTHAYRVRLCCVSLFSPRIDFNTLWNMPTSLTLHMFDEIMNRIAPIGVVNLMRGFYAKSKQEVPRHQLLELYMMSQELGTSIVDNFFPDKPNMNPYVRMAIEKIVFAIGKEHDLKIEKKKFEIMAKSGRMF